MPRIWPAILIGTAASCVIALPTPSVAQNDGFIFSGNQAVSATDKKQFISVGEKLSVSQFKRRFPSYNVTPEEGDCSGTCVSIGGKKEDQYLWIGYGGDRSSNFYTISSSAHSSRDTLGNTIGTPLRKAVGANTTKCDEGMAKTCQSVLIEGLSYIVGGCDWKTTVIPACAKIEGFEIHRFQQH
jgi:hypothetical protein